MGIVGPFMALDTTVIGKPIAPQTFSYGWKDTVLYALGVGAKKDELDWLYEGRGPKGPRAENVRVIG